MNIKKVIGFGLIGLSLTFAQENAPVAADAQAPVAEPVAAEPQASPAEPVAAPVPATPVAEVPAPEAVPVPAPVVESAVPEVPAPVEVAPEPAPVPETPVTTAAAEPVVPEAEAPAENAPAPETAQAEPVAPPAPQGPGFTPRPKTQFDVLHGNAYNRQRNVAAANNIDLLLRYPNLFANQKFLYIEPSGEMGVASFGNFFTAVDVSGEVGRLTLGYSQLGFGLYLKAGVGQLSVKNEQVKRRASFAGDDLGLAVSKTIVGYNVGLTADWLTFADEENIEPKHGVKIEHNYRNLSVNLSVTNAPRADRLFWTVGAMFNQKLNELKEGGTVISDSSDSYMQATPVLRLDYIGLQNNRARVLAGLGFMVPITIHEEYTFKQNGHDYTQSHNEYTAVLEPHLMGEVFLNKYVMFFGEASYQWVVASYQDSTDFYGNDTDEVISLMNQVDASLGLRLQYDNFIACEFALGDKIFTDTKAAFDGEGVFVSFGAFIYF